MPSPTRSSAARASALDPRAIGAHGAVGHPGSDTSDAPFLIADIPATSATLDLPKEFALTGVSPNPAFGPARIDYSVAREARVRIEIIDVQGRIVATPFDGDRPPGRYQVIWNGESARGTNGAGVYFVRYHAADVTRVKRLVMAH
jgi:hypothetical protein